MVLNCNKLLRYCAIVCVLLGGLAPLSAIDYRLGFGYRANFEFVYMFGAGAYSLNNRNHAIGFVSVDTQNQQWVNVDVSHNGSLYLDIVFNKRFTLTPEFSIGYANYFVHSMASFDVTNSSLTRQDLADIIAEGRGADIFRDAAVAGNSFSWLTYRIGIVPKFTFGWFYFGTGLGLTFTSTPRLNTQNARNIKVDYVRASVDGMFLFDLGLDIPLTRNLTHPLFLNVSSRIAFNMTKIYHTTRLFKNNDVLSAANLINTPLRLVETGLYVGLVVQLNAKDSE